VSTPAVVALLAAAFLLGSIPFSFLVARGFGVRDVRSVGSGNVGATNVLRSAGPAAGALAFLLDASKGALAAVLAERVAGPGLVPPLAAAVAVLGHLYPPWLGFRGGKGVATGAGAFLPLAPLATVAALVVFGVVAATTRYVSLGSVAGALALPLVAWLTGAPREVWAVAALVALLIVLKHRDNLRRLLGGDERRLGEARR
jgi:glycerol-3-phosphate acyltransferase PlsY